MSWIHGLRHRLRTLFTPRAYERDVNEEMKHHLELDAMQQHDAGAARRRFGNRTYYKEEARRMTWLAAADGLRQDLRYAWRSIRRTPGFTAVVVLTLALGLGANAATFSVLDRLYLRHPAGVRDPAELHQVWFWHSGITSSDGKSRMGSTANHPMYRAVVNADDDPRNVALYATDFMLNATRDDKRTRIRAVFASANYFSVLGVRPVLGRVYTASEDSLGNGQHVVVLSHRFWTRETAADSGIVGQRIRIEAEDYTIIGVLPAEFTGLDLQAMDAWIPLAAIPRAHWMASHERWWENVNPWGFTVLRRATGAKSDRRFELRATLALRDVNRRLSPRRPDTLMTVHSASRLGAGLGEPGQEMIISTRLSAVALIVLVIACANVTNLLLARAVRRRREIAVRLAMGISRPRLVRLLTTETVLLAALAGFASLVVAWWGGVVLRGMLVGGEESPLHWRVVVFTAAASLLAGLVAGIVPALQASAPELTSSLKEGARDGAVHRSRLRNALVIVQAAFTVVLLVGAALFVRSLNAVTNLDIGYDADRVVFASVSFDVENRLPRTTVSAQLAEIGDRMRHRPGVEAVARMYGTPMRFISEIAFFWGPGGIDSSRSLVHNFPTFSPVSSEYFDAVGTRLVRGTTFLSQPGATPQLVVNEAMAKLLWPNTDALGQCVRFETRGNPCYTVVGISENARQSYVIEEPKPQFYLPIDNLPVRGYAAGTLAVRAVPEGVEAVSATLLAEMRRAFPTGNPHVQTMLRELEPEYRPWRLGATLFTSFGLLALLVALIGIYSTTAYSVTQRRHEFGVRLALGARLGHVLSLVVLEGVRVVALGVATGIVLAIAMGKLVSALLYDVKPTDPIALTVVAGALLLTAVAAALVPAWRASRVDPVTALRGE